MVAGVDFLLHLKVSHPCSMNPCKWSSTFLHTSSVCTRSSKLVVRASRRSNGQRRKRSAYEEVIFQLESMKEPGEVLDSIGGQLSAQDLEQVLSHFAEEGRDSWFALEVFEWMQRANRVEYNTHKLMLNIMENWAKRSVEQGEPLSSSLYEDKDNDPLSSLIVVMVLKDAPHAALKLVFDLRSSGFVLKGSTYRVAVLAAVREQKLLADSLHGEKFIHEQAEEITGWAAEDESSRDVMPTIYERLLTMYCLAGKATDAERNLWTLKVIGRSPIPSMFNSILGIYASNDQPADAYSFLNKMESVGQPATKLTFSVLIGGFLKGGNPGEAASVLLKMIERGLRPDRREILATLRSLRTAEFVSVYLNLCKILAEEELMEPYVLYFHIESLNLWIMRLL